MDARCDLSAYPPKLIDFIAHRAKMHANLLVDAMNRSPEFKEVMKNAPKELMLDASALVQIVEWEKQKTFLSLDVGLPTAVEAVAEILRVHHSPDSTDTYDRSNSLSSRVLEVACRFLAWQGQEQWNTDIAIDFEHQEQFIDSMVESLLQLFNANHIAEDDE